MDPNVLRNVMAMQLADGQQPTITNRGMLVPRVEYSDGSQGWGVPGLLMEPWQAMQRLQAGASDEVGRMTSGQPFSREAIADALTVGGSAAMGSVAAPKPAGYDGLALRNVIDSPFGSEVQSDVYAMFNPGHVRSATTGELLYANPKESAALNAAIQGERQSQKGITAYHGSPHDYAAERLIQWPDGRTEYIVGKPDVLPDIPAGAQALKDFPLGRVRLDKMGSGEGTQAQGPGWYAGENEAVAKWYRDNLMPSQTKANYSDSIERANLSPHDKAYLKAIADYSISGGMSDTLPNLVEYDLQRSIFGIRPQDPAAVKAAAQDMMGAGRMYEVRINADPEDFLDWDKPLSQQSEKVRELAAGNQRAAKSLEFQADFFKSEPTGKAAFRAFASGPSGDPTSELAAANALREAGIPGIKYLDQGSRAAGEGSRNYVVFDDSLVEILRKYGVAGGMSLLGLSQQLGQQDTY